MQRLAQLGHTGVQRGHTGAQRLDGSAVVGGLALDALAALSGALQLGVGLVNAEAAVLALVFQNGDLTLAAGVGLGDGADVGVGLLDRQHQLLGLLPQGGALLVKGVQLAAQAVVVSLGGLVPALLVAQRVIGAADGVHPEGDLQPLALFAQLQKLLGLLAVPLERAYPPLQFTENVAQTLEVALGGGQTALGLVFAVAVFGDAGGFLKDLAALGGFGADDLGNAALPDDGVAVAADAGVEQQLIHILEADILAVDGVFTLAAAVVPAADRDLIGVHVKAVVAVVDRQCDRGKPHSAAGLGAAEDDILHLAGAAQLLGAGLAQHPADGVGYIRFAGAVRPDNTGDALPDGDLCLIGEGFKALDFQFFQAHEVVYPFDSVWS